MPASKPRKRPTPNKPDTGAESLQLAKRAMRLVEQLQDADPETYLTARAAALGLLTVHAHITGKPDPRQLHRSPN